MNMINQNVTCQFSSLYPPLIIAKKYLNEASLVAENMVISAKLCVPNPCNGNPCAVDFESNTYSCNCNSGYTSKLLFFSLQKNYSFK